jgi:glycosyltransferase involved in cell wall biosynthesis
MRDTIEAVMSAAPDTVVVALGARMREKRRDSASFLQVPFQSRAADVAAYYRAADIFVHTAAAEAFGKTVTEAMACGTTVVASAVGGIVEQIEDGVCGRLAPPGDAPAMARAIVSLLGDRATCARLGAAAEARGARYSLSRQADAFLAWYEAILEHIGAPSSASAPD